MKTLISIVLLLTVTSLNSSCSNENKLEHDKSVKKVFNESEIANFKKILSFFDSAVCELSEKTELAECYHDYFDYHLKSENLGKQDAGISFKKQLELFNSFDRSFIADSWEFARTHDTKSDKYYEFLNLKADGKFAKLVKLVSKEHEALKYYYETLQEAYSISPSMMAAITMSGKELNLKDDKIRLVIAVHYLTLNDEENSRREVDGYHNYNR